MTLLLPAPRPLVSRSVLGGVPIRRGGSPWASRAGTDGLADSLLRIQAQPREVWIVKLADRITDQALRIRDALGLALISVRVSRPKICFMANTSTS